MNTFDDFWCQKTRLDESARRSGKPIAPLTDIFPLLESALDNLERGPLHEKQTVSASLSDEQRQFLFNAARGMAVLAVRKNDTQQIRYGLLALMLEAGRYDSRETVSYLSLLDHSAKKVRANLGEFFESARARALAEMAAFTERFLAKPDAEKRIELFGYKEVDRPSGFDYKRSL